jgi:hypothetical protein
MSWSKWHYWPKLGLIFFVISSLIVIPSTLHCAFAKDFRGETSLGCGITMLVSLPVVFYFADWIDGLTAPHFINAVLTILLYSIIGVIIGLIIDKIKK